MKVWQANMINDVADTDTTDLSKCVNRSSQLVLALASILVHGNMNQQDCKG